MKKPDSRTREDLDSIRGKMAGDLVNMPSRRVQKCICSKCGKAVGTCVAGGGIPSMIYLPFMLANAEYNWHDINYLETYENDEYTVCPIYCTDCWEIKGEE